MEDISVRNRSMSSQDKKRARDRRAQQKRRDKVDARVKALEYEISLCRDNHQQLRCNELEVTIQQLRKENQVLLQRQRQIFDLLASWSAPGPSQFTIPADHSSIPPIEQWARITAETDSHSTGSADFDTNFSLDHVRTPAQMDDSSYALQSQHLNSIKVTSPVHPRSTRDNLSRSGPTIHMPTWYDLPLSQANEDSKYYLPWLSCPDVVRAMPDLPLPQDLLYGSSKNPVANSIYIALKQYYSSTAVRMACGWLIYVYTKWRMCPTKERYSTIPSYFRPTLTQLTLPHRPMLDNLVFPQIRDSLIRSCRDEDLDRVFSSFSFHLSLEFPSGSDYLRPDEQGLLEFSPDYYNAFCRLESWSLDEKFYIEFPQFANANSK